jgi:hypothetical protein
MAFCENCGARTKENDVFCSTCSSRQSQSSSAVGRAPRASEAGLGVPDARSTMDTIRSQSFPLRSAFVPGPASPPQKKGSLAKILIPLLGIFGLIMVGSMGTCFYVGYQVQKKAGQFDAKYSGDVGKLTAAAGGRGATSSNAYSNPTAPSPGASNSVTDVEVIPDYPRSRWKLSGANQ